MVPSAAATIHRRTGRRACSARGALYATKVDAQIRQASQGTKSLEHVLRDLLARALKERAPLPLSTWLEAVAKARGTAEQADFDRWIEQGREPRLPPGALGNCFRSVTAPYEIFSLGFDEAATQASMSRQVVGLDPRGPAYRAGLREGDAVRSVRYRRGEPRVPAKVKVQRDGKTEQLSYRPVGGSRPGQTWRRVAGIDDDKCPR